ncbi:hypothetical protein BGX23_011222 [Mortierella sp. AD031]|nr:hypothetical protein BGX23_011222 [Mortierella sp. AD031]
MLGTGVFVNRMQQPPSWFRLWNEFFFVCQPLIRQFAAKLDYGYVDLDQATIALDNTDYFDRAGIQAMSALPRHGPLARLTELVLPSVDEYTITAVEIQEILVHCSSVENLALASLALSLWAQLPIAIVNTCCPRLRVLSYIGGLQGAELLFMEAMPGAQVEEVQFVECEVKPGWNMAFINLEDAVEAVPWKYNRLHHLKLTITKTALPHCDPESLATLDQLSTRFQYSTTVQGKLKQLEMLYHQIGMLTELEYLNLRTVMVDVDEFTVINADGEEDWLRGLKKLKEFRGSFYADTVETKVTIGWREVRWMAAYWPKLEVAEFLYFEGNNIPGPFQWLKSQYKENQLALSVPLGRRGR